jgi:hypothetical protein
MSETAEAVYDDITVSGNADAGDTAPSAAPPVVEQAAVDVDEAVGDESDATKAAKVLAAQRKKNDPAKRTGSIQDEINAETARKHAAKRDADAEAARLADLRRQREDLERSPAKADEKPTAPAFYTRPRPTLDEIGAKYTDWEAYNEDLQDWKLDERDAKRDHEMQAKSQQQFQHDVLTKAQARIDAFKAEHPDYDDVVSKAMIPAGSQSARAVIDHLNHSELGAALAYELAQHPAELARIAGLPFGFAIAALGRLEHTIELRTAAADSGPAPTAPTYTPAKPPIKPVASSPVTSSDDGDPDDLSEAAINAHVKRENARDLKRRQR